MPGCGIVACFGVAAREREILRNDVQTVAANAPLRAAQRIAAPSIIRAATAIVTNDKTRIGACWITTEFALNGANPPKCVS